MLCKIIVLSLLYLLRYQSRNQSSFKQLYINLCVFLIIRFLFRYVNLDVTSAFTGEVLFPLLYFLSRPTKIVLILALRLAVEIGLCIGFLWGRGLKPRSGSFDYVLRGGWGGGLNPKLTAFKSKP